MAVHFIVQSEPSWQSVLDDTKWQNKSGETVNFTWTGSEWQTAPMTFLQTAAIEVKTGSSWAVGFRPTKVRITWNTTGGQTGQGSWDIAARDTANFAIFTDPADATVGAEIDITWNGQDIDHIKWVYFQSGPSQLHITNIEFFG